LGIYFPAKPFPPDFVRTMQMHLPMREESPEREDGMIKKWLVLGLVVAALSGMFTLHAEASKDDFSAVPAKGKVTLLDFGAKNCMPCIMLAPIIEQLKKQYDGKAEIHFVDVRKHRDLTQKHRIRSIPTLVFFDEKGNEAYRHIGFLDKYFIEKKLKDLGVE